MLGPATVAALSEQLRRLLAEIDAGRLVATPAEQARIEGALAALDAVLGVDPREFVRRLRPVPA